MYIDIIPQFQCIGSGSGSGTVGSTTFWHPGSGAAKYVDSRFWIQEAKYQAKTFKKLTFFLETQKLTV